MIHTPLLQKYIVTKTNDDFSGECISEYDSNDDNRLKKYKYKLSSPIKQSNQKIDDLVNKIRTLCQLKHIFTSNVIEFGKHSFPQSEHYCLIYTNTDDFLALDQIVKPIDPIKWIDMLIKITETFDFISQFDIRHHQLSYNNIFVSSSFEEILIGSPAQTYFKQLEKLLINQDQMTNAISISDYLFIAPEQTNDEECDSIESVIYRLGLISYYALTKKLPFEAKNSYEIVKHHLISPLPPLEPASLQLEHQDLFQILVSMTEKDPQKRISLSEITRRLKKQQKSLQDTLTDDEQSTNIPTNETSTIIANRYKLIKILGQGGFGTVYYALDMKIADRAVAIKLLNVDIQNNVKVAELFEKEAKVMSRLSHPNTLRLLDYGKSEQGIPYMVSELLKGSSLEDYIAQKGQLDILETLEIILNVSEALNDAHRLGIVHRDIKPDNIFITPINQRKKSIKLLDFGIAKIKEGAQLTIAGGAKTQGVMGTPFYMSPEQHDSTNTVDGRSDIYSLGIVLFQCLTGKVPFDGHTYYEIVKQHKETPVPEIITLKNKNISQQLLDEINDLLESMLEKNKDERIQTTDELITILDELIDKVKMLKVDDFVELDSSENKFDQSKQNTDRQVAKQSTDRQSARQSAKQSARQRTKQNASVSDAKNASSSASVAFKLIIVALLIGLGLTYYLGLLPTQNLQTQGSDNQNTASLQNANLQNDSLQNDSLQNPVNPQDPANPQDPKPITLQGNHKTDTESKNQQDTQIQKPILLLIPSKMEYVVDEFVKLKLKVPSDQPVSYQIIPKSIASVKNNKLTFKSKGKGNISACIQDICSNPISFNVSEVEVLPE